jgi:glycosyltransferase involved in cell wall biosynthesis
MKLGAAIPVLNEWRFIPAVAGQLFGVVDRLVLLRPQRSQSGAPVHLTPIPDLDPRIEVLEGNWRSESETRNAGMSALSDCDYVFMVDSDEILLDEDLAKLKDMCLQDQHRVIAVRLYTYWKTARHRIDPPEDGTIKLVLRKDVRIHGVREVAEPAHTADVFCHHLSYVRTDDELREKIRLSGHAPEILPDWYDKVWKAWDENPDLENLHPVHPQAYRRAIREVGSGVEDVLTRWNCR